MTPGGLVLVGDRALLDEDEAPLLEALAGLGVPAGRAAWDDPTVDWASAGVAVVRSTWDYVDRRDEFLAWAEAVASVTRLVHPPEVLRWNTDKRYLGDLARAGLEVMPTTFVGPGGDLEAIDDVVADVVSRATGPVVVKPAVGAGAQGAAIHDVVGGARDGSARVGAHASAIVAAGGTALVQPYRAAVESDGEVALVVVGGRLSHAVAKSPMLTAGAPPATAPRGPERLTPHDPTDAERDLVDRVLVALAGLPDLGPALAAPLYARIDVVAGAAGRPEIMEVELTEPALFLGVVPGAVARFATVLAAEYART